MSRPLSRKAVASAFARSFLIQGSWNYHTMIGSGFAFAMLPALRRLYGGDPEALDASVRRHLEHFNAHPYLANLALGAALRLESDGAAPEVVRRFKLAVRSPLGSLGDSLVWATWLPGMSVAALALFWLGFPPWVVVVVFLVGYNIGHVALRVWGFRTGLAEGQGVARSLGRADIGGWTGRLQPVAVGLLGLLVGAVLGDAEGLAASGAVWVVLGVVSFVVGLNVGHRAWRPAAMAVVVAIVITSAVGVLT